MAVVDATGGNENVAISFHGFDLSCKIRGKQTQVGSKQTIKWMANINKVNVFENENLD